MSALPHHYIQTSSDISNTQLTSKNRTKLSNTSQKLPSNFPKPREFPAYLKILLLLQKGSLGVACLSIVTGIILYLSSVSLPQKWSKEYRNLENLQRQERQLTTVGETLKYKLAQQAQELQLSPITSQNTVFLKPKSLAINPHANQVNPDKSLKKTNLGY